jgi:hypothetical protein
VTIPCFTTERVNRNGPADMKTQHDPPNERGQDRGTIGGILFRLVVIAADDVATPGKRRSCGRLS